MDHWPSDRPIELFETAIQQIHAFEKPRDTVFKIMPGEEYMALFARTRVKRPTRKQLFNAKRRSILARKS